MSNASLGGFEKLITKGMGETALCCQLKAAFTASKVKSSAAEWCSMRH